MCSWPLTKKNLAIPCPVSYPTQDLGSVHRLGFKGGLKEVSHRSAWDISARAQMSSLGSHRDLTLVKG